MFEETIAFLQRIKFAGDLSILGCNDKSLSQKNRFKNELLKNELCISEAVTPSLFTSLNNVLSRLDIAPDQVSVFVYPSANFNAECYANNNEECVIRVSSSLIEILSPEEFEFVISHELGHFLLSHYTLGESDESLEYFLLRRAQEISADRIGLLGSTSLEVALRALLKTSSGLSDHHLKFNFGSFVNQLQKVTDSSNSYSMSSHPSITLRCRALLWFSMNSSFINNDKNFEKLELEKLDRRIQKDLDKFENGLCLEEIKSTKFDLEMWLAAKFIVSEGKLSKQNKDKFSEKFGHENLEKFLNFIEGQSTKEVLRRVNEKYELSQRELLKLTPRQFDSTLNELFKNNELIFSSLQRS